MQQVRRRDQQLAEQHPAPLPARKHAHFLERVVAFEHHEPADGAGFALGVVRVRVHDLLERGLLRAQPVDVRLAEVGDLRVRVELDLAARGRHLPRQQVQQRGLALAVLSDHGDAVLLAHGEGEPVDQLRAVLGEREGQVFHGHEPFGLEGRGPELEVEVLDLLELVELLVPCKRLDARLDRAGLGGLGAEAVDELLHLFAFLLVVLARLLVDLLFQQDLVVELLRAARRPCASCSGG